MPRPWNLRDLGGYATPDGTVRDGLIWRSSALEALDDDGRQALTDAGIITAVDLRDPGERAKQPSDLAGALALREIPLIDSPTLPREAQSVEGFVFWLLAARGNHLIDALRVLSAPEHQPVVFFCTSGKDRTGVLSALLLAALGVGDADIAEDFHRTEALMPAAHTARAIETGATIGVPAQTTRANMAAPRELIFDLIAHLRAEHGGPAAYLAAHGFAGAELDALRERMIAR